MPRRKHGFRDHEEWRGERTVAVQLPEFFAVCLDLDRRTGCEPNPLYRERNCQVCRKAAASPSYSFVSVYWISKSDLCGRHSKCEKAKFDEAKTHFDTNHCTTVPWSLDDKEEFKRQLIATLRRSLNLFPSKD
jgi:hypothetical protein